MNNLFFIIFIQSLFLSLTFLPVLSLENTKSETSEKTLVPENTDTKSDFNPKPASASLYNLGLKSYEQGDVKSAVSFFRRAIDLDPEFVDAYYNLGAIYKKQKDFPLAINSFQKAFDINNEDYDVAFELASCYFEEKSYQNAKKYFLLIPVSFPKYGEAKQKISLAEQSLASANSPNTLPGTSVNSKEFQAQLLADTLGKAEEEQKEPASEPQNTITSEQTKTAPAQLVVNNLAKPSKENLDTPFRVVTRNFNGPTGIAKDSKNNIYIANFTNDRVERITESGKREIFLEKNGIKGPVGLAVDGSDNVYVANYNGDSIIKISQDKEVSVVSNKVIRPYYLLFDSLANKLFVTVQGNDSLVEINTNPDSKQPITAN